MIPLYVLFGAVAGYFAIARVVRGPGPAFKVGQRVTFTGEVTKRTLGSGKVISVFDKNSANIVKNHDWRYVVQPDDLTFATVETSIGQIV